MFLNLVGIDLVAQDQTRLNGTRLIVQSLTNLGTFSGFGTIESTFHNNGRLQVDAHGWEFEGNFIQSTDAVVNMEITSLERTAPIIVRDEARLDG